MADYSFPLPYISGTNTFYLQSQQDPATGRLYQGMYVVGQGPAFSAMQVGPFGNATASLVDQVAGTPLVIDPSGRMRVAMDGQDVPAARAGTRDDLPEPARAGTH